MPLVAASSAALLLNTLRFIIVMHSSVTAASGNAFAGYPAVLLVPLLQHRCG
jgi:hypothetical protein